MKHKAEVNRRLVETINVAAQKLDLGEYDEAERLYAQALRLQGGNAAAIMGLAMLYNRTSRPAKARELLLKLILAFVDDAGDKKGANKEAPPKNAIAAIYVQLGLAYQLLGEPNEALLQYENAWSLSPMPELEKTIQALKNPVNNLSVQQKVLLDAHILLRAKNILEAEALLRKSLEQFPDDSKLLHLLSMLFRSAGKIDEALPLLQQAIILDPEEAQYYNDLGMIFQDKGDFQKAIIFHKRAISRKADFAIAYSNMGVAYKKLNKIADAIDAYREALVLQPDFAPAHNNLGNLLRITGDVAGAKRHLKKAIELAPDYEDAKVNLMELEGVNQ